MIAIESPNTASVERALALTQREIAKATARGINRATAAGRRAAQRNLKTVFPGARPPALKFFRLNVRFERRESATPERLQARVTVNAPNYAMRAPWLILTTFEDGGIQSPRDLIPTLGKRRAVPVANTPKPPAAWSPKNLGLAYRTDAAGSLFRAVGRGALGGASRGNQPAIRRGQVLGKHRTFVMKVGPVYAIMMRTGPKTIAPLWWLRPTQVVPRRPWFGDTSRRATEAVLDRYTAEEMAKQLTWARERRGVFG